VSRLPAQYTEVDLAGYPVHPAYATPVASAAGTVVIKGRAGRLCSITVTTTGSGLIVVYDNASAASGTIIASLPASPALGEYPIDMPAANGIVISAPASSPAVTVAYS
jgi:hypothetical protein